MKSLQQTYAIHAPIEKVWLALVDPKIITEWGGGPAQMDDKVGTHFKLWGGDIYGTNKKVIKNKELIQDWFGDKWEKPSIVTFTLKETNGTTELHLLHKDIPDSEAKDIDEGWKQYYLGPLKKVLEA